MVKILSKKRERYSAQDLSCATCSIYLKGGEEREREKERRGKNRVLPDQKYTRRMKIQWKQRIDEIKIPAIKRCTTMRQPLM